MPGPSEPRSAGPWSIMWACVKLLCGSAASAGRRLTAQAPGCKAVTRPGAPCVRERTTPLNRQDSQLCVPCYRRREGTINRYGPDLEFPWKSAGHGELWKSLEGAGTVGAGLRETAHRRSRWMKSQDTPRPGRVPPTPNLTRRGFAHSSPRSLHTSVSPKHHRHSRPVQVEREKGH